MLSVNVLNPYIPLRIKKLQRSVFSLLQDEGVRKDIHTLNMRNNEQKFVKNLIVQLFNLVSAAFEACI